MNEDMEDSKEFVATNETWHSIFGKDWYLPVLSQHPEWTWTLRKKKQPDAEYLESVRDATVSWIGDNQITSLYVYSNNLSLMNIQDFSHKTGIVFNNSKGAFITSKRTSRLFRPYSWFQHDVELNIIVDSSLDTKIFDGAGVVSRNFIQRFGRGITHNLYPSLQSAQHSSRVEFTIVNEIGQFKGHAFISDTLPDGVDFILPDDCKTQVKYSHEGQNFIGLQFPHYADAMKADVQSIVNLHTFLSYDVWQTSMAKYIADWKVRLHSGQLAQELSMSISNVNTDKKLWSVAEYIRSGGNQYDSPFVMRSLVQTMITELVMNNRSEKFRLPLQNGVRAYIFADAVAGLTIAKGYCRVDESLFVNASDWKEWVSEVSGGADQDDGYWIIPFTDVSDNVRKVLSWRSPNQLGEYVLLLADEHTSNTLNFSLELDSRNLPTRIDKSTQKYSNLIVPAKKNKLDFGWEACATALVETAGGAGTLGAMCNLLLYSYAMFGKLPEILPARLEDIIDSTVKTGDNLGKVAEWVNVAKAKLLKLATPTPLILKRRLGEYGAGLPTAPDTHWFSTIWNMVRAEISGLKEYKEQMGKETNLPMQILSYATEYSEYEQTALDAVNKYNQVIQTCIKDNDEPDFDLALAKASDIIEGSDNVRAVLCWIRVISARTQKPDSIVWMYQDGQPWLEINRELGIIDGLTQVGNRVQAYPYAQTIETKHVERVEIRGAWLHLLQNTMPEYQGMTMSEVYAQNKHIVGLYKQHVEKSAKALKKRSFTVKEGFAYSDKSACMGLCDAPEGAYSIKDANADDGKLTLLATPLAS